MNVLRNVTIIGHGCFKKCTNLESVTFENGSELKKIGEEAFYETNINKITIPKSVNLIEDRCFKKCNKLESVAFELGSELKKIGEEAFYETNINKITIPKSVKLIGKNCFKSYTDPKTIKIKDEPKSQKGV